MSGHHSAFNFQKCISVSQQSSYTIFMAILLTQIVIKTQKTSVAGIIKVDFCNKITFSLYLVHLGVRLYCIATGLLLIAANVRQFIELPGTNNLFLI